MEFITKWAMKILFIAFLWPFMILSLSVILANKLCRWKKGERKIERSVSPPERFFYTSFQRHYRKSPFCVSFLRKKCYGLNISKDENPMKVFLEHEIAFVEQFLNGICSKKTSQSKNHSPFCPEFVIITQKSIVFSGPSSSQSHFFFTRTAPFGSTVTHGFSSRILNVSRSVSFSN